MTSSIPNGGKRSTDEQRRNRLAPINHGTESGVRAHHRRLQEPCDECKAAGARAKQDRRKGQQSPRRDPMLARREKAAMEIRVLNRRDAETQRGAA